MSLLLYTNTLAVMHKSVQLSSTFMTFAVYFLLPQVSRGFVYKYQNDFMIQNTPGSSGITEKERQFERERNVEREISEEIFYTHNHSQ